MFAPTAPPAVRIRRAPPLEPPFEDEIDPTWPVRTGGAPRAGGQAVHPTGDVPAAGTSAALPADGSAAAVPAAGTSAVLPTAGAPTAGAPTAAPVAGGPPPLPTAQPGRGPRTQRPVTPRPHRGALDPGGPRPPGRRPHPTPGIIAAQRFVAVCIEILNGHRAASHLRAVTMPSDLKQITDQLLSRTNRAYLGRPGRTVTTPQRVRLVGLRMCEPRDGVVEAAAVLGYGTQTWAMAVRMERPHDTWLCKLVQVI